MWNKKSVLGVVPARGGSIGIKGKNLRTILGKSLVQHAIEIGKESDIIDFTVLTSDNKQILNEGSLNAVDLCIKRPDKFSMSDSSSVDAWIHAWEYSEKKTGKLFEYSVLIQPTSPNRTTHELEECFALLSEKDIGLVTTVSKVPSHFNPEKILLKKAESYTFFMNAGPTSHNRHYLPSYYFRNGNYYIASKKHLIEKRLFLETNCAYHFSINEPVNIDEEIDLEMGELIMTRYPKK